MLLTFAVTAYAGDKLAVAVNQSQVLTFNGVTRVAIANPEVADVVVVSGSEVLLVGKAPGATTLHVWSMSGRESYAVEVGANDNQIASEISAILGAPDIRVSKVNKNIILEGTVSDQYQKNRAEKIASAYGEKVINLLEITKPVQVKIEAKIIEINRDKVRNLGIKWGNDPANPGTFNFGQGVVNNTMGYRTFGNLGGYLDIRGQLDALVKDGVAKILSQPNIITLSGDKANIIVGGQIPVPVSQQNGSILIEWKDYGIKLDISPEVSGEGLISSKVKAEVSTLDWTSDHQIGLSANLKIPPINMRKAETAVTLASGQTMAIGGLISSETTQDVYKVPLLADIPVLGKLFTSKSFSRGETELVIFITSTIINPLEYTPNMTRDMQGTIKQDPWGGK
jgi:pilus assembly protein CpaC